MAFNFKQTSSVKEHILQYSVVNSGKLILNILHNNYSCQDYFP